MARLRWRVPEMPTKQELFLVPPLGLLAATTGDSAVVDVLLSSRSACVALLCQTLAHVELLQPMVGVALADVHAGIGSSGLC